jgi:hypothetical protein
MTSDFGTGSEREGECHVDNLKEMLRVSLGDTGRVSMTEQYHDHTYSFDDSVALISRSGKDGSDHVEIP